VKHKAETLLRSRHAGERMLRCWGSGAGLAFEDTRDAIKKLLSVRPHYQACTCDSIQCQVHAPYLHSSVLHSLHDCRFSCCYDVHQTLRANDPLP